MKTTNYKKGDVLIFEDGKRYEYLSTEYIAGVLMNVYKPFAPKVAAEAAAVKWYKKVLQWWGASNRWKHFLFAIPLGAVCGASFTTGVGLGMEVKDHLYGGRADFVDFLLTAVGGAIGHGAMLAVGLDYVIALLINLIF